MALSHAREHQLFDCVDGLELFDEILDQGMGIARVFAFDEESGCEEPMLDSIVACVSFAFARMLRRNRVGRRTEIRRTEEICCAGT